MGKITKNYGKSVGINLLEEHFFISRRGIVDDLCNDTPIPDPSLIPSSLLPMYDFESTLSGFEALTHRRGRGWDYPSESKVWSGANINCGRVPVLSAVKSFVNKKWGEKNESEFQWQPFTETRGVRSDKIISDVVASLTKGQDDVITVVLPEGVNETGQETIAKSLNTHPKLRGRDCYLLPETMATVLGLNSNFGLNLQSYKHKETIGHIKLFSLGLDFWSISLVEIKVAKTEKGPIIVPVFSDDLTVTTPLSGLAYLISKECRSNGNDLPAVWNRIFGSNRSIFELFNSRESQINAWKHLNDPLHCRGVSLFYERLPHCAFLKSELHPYERCLADALQQLHVKYSKLSSPAKNCIGNLFRGKWKDCFVNDTQTLQDFIKDHLRLNEPTIQEGFSTSHLMSQGAANFGYRLANNLPTYYENLVPISIYYEKPDEYGDPAPAWLSLVKSETAEGGKPYKNNDIKGLKIPGGHSKLRLILRRPEKQNEENKFEYREVVASLSESQKNDESVLLHAVVKPGQGYAQVTVESVKEGLFTTELDWESMTPRDEPKISKLRYMRQCVKILPDSKGWDRVEPIIEKLELLAEEPRKNSESILTQLRELIKVFNKKRRKNSGSETVQNNILFSSLVGSEGEVLNRAYFERLIRVLNHLWSSNIVRRDVFEQLIRLSSWLYTSAPEEIKESITDDLFSSFIDITATRIQFVGHCLIDKASVKRFYTLLIEKLNISLDGTTNWIRCFSHLVKLRQNVLSDDYIDEVMVNRLTRHFLSMFKKALNEKHFKRTFTVVLWAILFLIKRRRYQPDFIDVDHPLGEELNLLLERGFSEDMSHTQTALLEKIERFLNAKGSEDDEAGVFKLIEDEDE